MPRSASKVIGKEGEFQAKWLSQRSEEHQRSAAEAKEHYKLHQIEYDWGTWTWQDDYHRKERQPSRTAACNSSEESLLVSANEDGHAQDTLDDDSAYETADEELPPFPSFDTST